MGPNGISPTKITNIWGMEISSFSSDDDDALKKPKR